MRKSVLVIGVGNEYRGDDGAGIIATRKIRAMQLPGVEVRENPSDALALIDAWKGFDFVIVIDAVFTEEDHRNVKIHRFEAHENRIPSSIFNYSTHVFGLSEAIELARSLCQLPRVLIVYGIEGICFEERVGISAEVKQAVSEVTDQVIGDIHSALKKEIQVWHA